MKVFLVIALVCGVVSCHEYERMIRLSRPAAARRGDPKCNDAVDPTFVDNERLIKVVQSVQANLVYSVDEENNAAKRDFTKFSYFFYLYLEANTNDVLGDIKEALGKYLKVAHKPSYVLVGPVRAVFSKFVAAVSRRVAVVQDECQDVCDHTCVPDLERRDLEAIAKCLLYYQNVRLHETALDNVESAEQVLQLALEFGGALKSSQSEDILRRLELPTYEEHFKNVKKVYKVLQRYSFKCSYQDDNQNDEVNSNKY